MIGNLLYQCRIVPFSATFQLCATEAGIRRLIPSFSKFISPIYFRIRSRRFPLITVHFSVTTSVTFLAGCCTQVQPVQFSRYKTYRHTAHNFKYNQKPYRIVFADYTYLVIPITYVSSICIQNTSFSAFRQSNLYVINRHLSNKTKVLITAIAQNQHLFIYRYFFFCIPGNRRK